MAEKESLPLAALEDVIREELASGGSAVINGCEKMQTLYFFIISTIVEVVLILDFSW